MAKISGYPDSGNNTKLGTAYGKVLGRAVIDPCVSTLRKSNWNPVTIGHVFCVLLCVGLSGMDTRKDTGETQQNKNLLY